MKWFNKSKTELKHAMINKIKKAASQTLKNQNSKTQNFKNSKIPNLKTSEFEIPSSKAQQTTTRQFKNPIMQKPKIQTTKQNDQNK